MLLEQEAASQHAHAIDRRHLALYASESEEYLHTSPRNYLGQGMKWHTKRLIDVEVIRDSRFRESTLAFEPSHWRPRPEVPPLASWESWVPRMGSFLEAPSYLPPEEIEIAFDCLPLQPAKSALAVAKGYVESKSGTIP